MPLYEYECDENGHRFEVIQKFSDLPIDKCPQCGSPVHKLMSSPAIQFKGSGWYITDYARKGGDAARGDKGGDKDASKEGKDATAAKPDSSSATTTDASSAKATGESKSGSKPAATSAKKD